MEALIAVVSYPQPILKSLTGICTPTYSEEIAMQSVSAASMNPSPCSLAVSSVSPMLCKKCSRDGRPIMPALIPVRTSHACNRPRVVSYAW